MTYSSFSRLPWPILSVLGAVGAALPTLSGCSDSSNSSPPNPITTAPAPNQPDQGLTGDRPDPCRGVALPADQHYVAPGLCASAVAFGQEGLRQISFASNGDLLAVKTDGSVLRFRDLNSDGSFDGASEIATIGNTGGNGNNAHLDEASGFLYAGSPDGVVRWPYSAQAAALGAPEEVVIDQPSSGTHTYHTVHVYDGWLYVHSGSENNLVAPAAPDYDRDRALLKRFDLSQFRSGAPFDWASGELVALGLRNMVGYTRDAQGALFGVVNGIDDLEYQGADVHLNNPGEVLIRIDAGRAYGYPFCFTAQRIQSASGMVPPGTQLATALSGFDNPHDDAWCAQNSEAPLSFLPAHSAPLDITFHARVAGAPLGLPEEWLGGAFVTQHGSWNTEPSVGHAVVYFPFGSSQPAMPETTQTPPVFPYTVVLSGGDTTGPVDGEWGWHSGESGEEQVRPVGVAVSPVDGALYISSDSGGVVYRVGVPL